MGKDITDIEKSCSVRSASPNELNYLEQVIASGNLSSLMGGTFTPRFEKKFAEIMDARYAVAMNSCMSALHSAVIAAGAGAGTEVICDPEYIFGSIAVLYNNAIPVYVDINPVTHNMDPDKLASAITERTKAIIVTHAWGLPAEMDRIMEIAKKHNVMVIEDCAEAILAKYKGKYTGTLGDVGCFSFQASKQMPLGDAGMATTKDEKIHKALANMAGAPTFLSIAYSLDYNYRINEPTSAIGLAKLETLHEAIGQLVKNANYYDKAVEDCDWITLQRGPDGAEHSFYYWAATFTGDNNGPDFEEFKKEIEKAQFSSISIGYTQMPAYKHPLIKNRAAAAFSDERNKHCRQNYEDGCCPVAERVIPRLILGYVIEPEETARQEAQKLHNVIQKFL